MEEGTLVKAAKFTGKDLDEDTGLYYFNARWYDQEIGRFISQDPIADEPDFYSYGSDNPLKYIDPTGMFNFEVNFAKGGELAQSSISAICAFNPELLEEASFIKLFIGINNMIEESKMITMKDLKI